MLLSKLKLEMCLMLVLVPNVTRMTHSFSKNVLYNISTNGVVSDKLDRGRDDVEGMTIDAFIVAERDFHEMDNLDDCEFIND